jgi:hypothetical protein
LEERFGLLLQLPFALAANGMGDRELRLFRTSRFLHSHDPPAPRANDIEEHAFTSFLRAQKKPPRGIPLEALLPVRFI